jgi:2-polyprenyl-3-methyl-5-hydroxy-6-metoxy-1,4-benzoquinol methylase
VGKYDQYQSNELELVKACDLCGGLKFESELVANGWNLARCNGCGLVFTSPRYTEVYLQKMYEDRYYEIDSSYLSAQLLEPSEDEYRLAKSLMKICACPRGSQTLRFLDIGCGGGFIVNAFQNAGWEAIGIDLSWKAIIAGKSRGLDLHVAGVENAGLGKFDLVAAFHVLEHVYSPKKFLHHCTERLLKNGYMLIEVPDYGCRAVRKMRQNWPYLYPDKHLYQFTNKTLAQYLIQAKLDLIKIEKVHGRGLVQGYSPSSAGKVKNANSFKNVLLRLRPLFFWSPKGRQLLRHLFCHTLGYGEFIRVLVRKTY